ncbi:MAG: response regulator, partial [Methylococcaceae bacterium]|nr:response regulator [Methylococcaceae bacterium]
MANCESSTATCLAINPQTRHDLLNWLNQIIGYSEMLAEEADSSGQKSLVGDLGNINSAAQQMLERLETLFSCSNDYSIQSIDNRLLEIKEVQRADLNKNKTSLPDRVVSGKILVVDDNAANQEILSRRLEKQGYQIVLADCGSQALEKLRHDSFDLVLLDVMMPDMDGYEVLQ